MTRSALVRRLLIGWSFTLVSFAVLLVFPRIELSFYDRLITQYRDLPQQFPLLNRGYMGLHRSITLLGDNGQSLDGPDISQVLALRHLREDLAAAACWITNEDQKLPRDLRNEPLETSLVYAVTPSTQWDGKIGDAPPLILKQSEPDSIVREVYLALKGPKGLIPCLPLVLYAKYLGEPEAQPEIQGRSLLLGDRSIPVNEDQQGYTFPIVPYATQLRAQTDLTKNEWATTVSDPMEPISLKDALALPKLYFGNRVRERFYFIGDFSMTALGEHVTSMGPFRDFQIGAIGLDTLIQGPYLRWVSGWPGVVYYTLTSSLLALWLLSPTSLMGRLVRLCQVIAAWQILSLAAFACGYYFPIAWLLFYTAFLTIWIAAKIWWSALTYLRRYGGATAAHLLATGKLSLDHSVAEERIVTIVFIGLPGHLRQQELENDPKTLEHRQIFSKRVADITQRHHGIVHDFQADYLMLGFGTHPGEQEPDHAVKAFRAANELIASKEFFVEAWKPYQDEGARVQVSLNAGLVAVGWVGTTNQKQASAAIGDTTNVAARLLGTAKKYNVDLILSESTHELLKDQAAFEALPPVMLKGKTEAVAIYKMVTPE